MSVEGVDVGQQRAHDGRHAGTHVLRRQTRKMTAQHNTRVTHILMSPLSSVSTVGLWKYRSKNVALKEIENARQN